MPRPFSGYFMRNTEKKRNRMQHSANVCDSRLNLLQAPSRNPPRAAPLRQNPLFLRFTGFGSLPGGTDEFRASDINCVRLFNFMTLYHVPSGLSRPFCNFLYQILHFCENRTVRQVKARRSLSNPSKTRARGQAMFMRRKVSPPRPYWLPFDRNSPVRSRISRASATESSV